MQKTIELFIYMAYKSYLKCDLSTEGHKKCSGYSVSRTNGYNGYKNKLAVYYEVYSNYIVNLGSTFSCLSDRLHVSYIDL